MPKKSKLQCRWVGSESNPLYGRGFEGRRWILYEKGAKKEEVSIEDGEPEESDRDTPDYEIVGHHFKSGDIETIDYAKTLQAARKKVRKFFKENPCGQYR